MSKEQADVLSDSHPITGTPAEDRPPVRPGHPSDCTCGCRYVRTQPSDPTDVLSKGIMAGGCVKDPFEGARAAQPGHPIDCTCGCRFIRYPLPENYEQPYDVEHVFSYHVPTDEDIRKFENIRNAAKILAYAIIDNAPHSADQKIALNNLRIAVMYANAAIVLKGRTSTSR